MKYMLNGEIITEEDFKNKKDVLIKTKTNFEVQKVGEFKNICTKVVEEFNELGFPNIINTTELLKAVNDITDCQIMCKRGTYTITDISWDINIDKNGVSECIIKMYNANEEVILNVVGDKVKSSRIVQTPYGISPLGKISPTGISTGISTTSKRLKKSWSTFATEIDETLIKALQPKTLYNKITKVKKKTKKGYKAGNW